MVVLDENVPCSSEAVAMNKRRKRKRTKKNIPSTGAEESELQNPMEGEEEEEGDAEGNVPEEKVKEEEKKNKKRKSKMKKGELYENTSDGEGKDGVEGEVEKDKEKKNEKKKVKTDGSGIMSTVSFDSLELSEKTLRAIKDMGFEHMTQVRFLLGQVIIKYSLEIIVCWREIFYAQLSFCIPRIKFNFKG